MPMKRYKVIKPFQIHNGPLLPIGTSVLNYNGMIVNNNHFMCLVSSDHSHECLVGNDDNNWERRSQLIKVINKMVYCEDMPEDLPFSNKSDVKEKRLEALWSYARSKKYCRGGRIEEDAWLWNDEYYCADLGDLEKIRKMLSDITY